MSIRVMAEMWNADLNPNLSGGLLLLALALADWCNDDGECYPSIAQLAKKTRVSEATVRNWLATLEESGVIAVLPNSGRASKVGKTNKYLFIEYREKNNLPTSPTRFYTRKKSPRFATIEGGKRFEGGKPVDPVGGKPVDPLGGKNAYPITSLDTSLDTSNKNIDVAKATSLGVFSDDAEERTQPLSEGKQNPAPTEGKPKKPRPTQALRLSSGLFRRGGPPAINLLRSTRT
jgi:hypothetical protein